MLEVNNISFKYKNKGFQLSDVSLEAEEGYIYTIIGENGSGKTTLLKLIYGMLTPKSGEILWNSTKLGTKILPAFHREVAFVGGVWCVADYSIEKNMDILSTLYPDFDKEFFEKMLSKADLDSVKNNPYNTLSKGQQVKAEIIFNLAKRPKFMILDEPLASLDPVYKVDILEILQTAVANDNLGILMSTNLLDEIRNITDYAGIMKDGSLVRWGESTSVFSEGRPA